MRILLDENVDLRAAIILSTYEHEVVHVGQSKYRSLSDIELATVAREFDAFITCDLHRQLPEWLETNSALIESGVTLIRIRLPESANEYAHLVRSLTFKIEEITTHIRDGKSLITISASGTTVRARTREEVMKMIQDRLSG